MGGHPPRNERAGGQLPQSGSCSPRIVRRGPGGTDAEASSFRNPARTTHARHRRAGASEHPHAELQKPVLSFPARSPLTRNRQAGGPEADAPSRCDLDGSQSDRALAVARTPLTGPRPNACGAVEGAHGAAQPSLRVLKQRKRGRPR